MTKSRDGSNDEWLPRTDRKPDLEDMSDQQSAEWLTEGMQRFDAAFEPGAPSIEQLTALVEATRKDARGKLWRDLALLWGIGCVAVGGMAFAWTDNVLWIVGIQAVGAVVGLAALGGMLAKRSGKGLKGKWTN